jgi:DNA end-binding protein Ku
MATSRTSWRGFLKLSLVSCPIRLMPAVTMAGRTRFHNIIRGTEQRVEMRAHDAETGEELEREELVKGYEAEKGRFVVVSEDELEALEVESSRTLDLDVFVPAEEVDRIYYDDSYYLAPDGAVADETFRVVRAAIAREKRIGIGRFVVANRERMVALEPRGPGLMMTTLRPHAEVRKAGDAFEEIAEKRPDAKMVELAGEIIDKMSGTFDPADFEDRYETALRKLVEAKAKGRKPPAQKEGRAPAAVIDLMAALKKSLQREVPTTARASRAAAADKPRQRKKKRA